ncbi:hypothetical protein IWW48_000378 [Coemansia sp. RSA 1200]|nr:hypothetical protein IWW48_000378 [Coemansia sp. RSA 1200]
MTLFGNLPPPEPKKEQTAQQGTDTRSDATVQNSDKPSVSARSWAAPEFIPNLRRQQRATAAAASASTKLTGPSAAAVNGMAKPLNPKHPHSLPQNPEQLISKWEAAKAADEAPLERAAPAAAAKHLPHSLAQYLPATQKTPKSRLYGSGGVPDTFDPFDEYNPIVPNDYQMYKVWITDEKKRRAQAKKHMAEVKARGDDINPSNVSDDSDTDSNSDSNSSSDGNNSNRKADAGQQERDPGRPSVWVVLTNMADEIDEDLERETIEECSTFGKVVQCVAETVPGADEANSHTSRFERVRVVVEFAELDAAIRAREAIDRRFFDGRHISATFGSLATEVDRRD